MRRSATFFRDSLDEQDFVQVRNPVDSGRYVFPAIQGTRAINAGAGFSALCKYDETVLPESGPFVRTTETETLPRQLAITEVGPQKMLRTRSVTQKTRDVLHTTMPAKMITDTDRK